jgi:flagellar L-ring protein FlgH
MKSWILGSLLFAIAAPLAAQTAEPGAPANRGRWDWTTDAGRFAVGDIVSVLVDEYTIATANRTTLAQQDRNRRTTLNGGYSAAGVSGDVSAGVRTGNSADSRNRGRDSRQDRLAAEVTAHVIAVEPDGTLRIEGTKMIKVDAHEKEILVRGLARPEDVMNGNVIDSWRLADAEIAYVTNGKLVNAKGGILGRILLLIWP